MLYDKTMEAYLTKEAEEFAEPVIALKKEFVVFDEEPSEAVVQRCIATYQGAVEAMEKWVRKVMLAEMMLLYGRHEVSCRLLLPDGEHIVRVCYDGECLCSDTLNENMSETLHTPIGEISDFMFTAITEVPNNPVKLFYLYLSECVHWIHDELAMHYEGVEGHILTKNLLKCCGIFDVIGVYQMDSLLLGVEEFFKPRYKS